VYPDKDSLFNGWVLWECTNQKVRI
jgi:hypothetical protein